MTSPTLVKFTDVTMDEKAGKDKKKRGIRGFLKRTWKAIKRPFHHSHETKVEVFVPDTSEPCSSDLQQEADGEQIGSEQTSPSGPCQPQTTAFPSEKARDDDHLDVVSVISVDRTAGDNIQQIYEPPADASVEEEESKPREKEKKDVRGFFKRTWKAVKRPFCGHCSKTKMNQEEHVKVEKKKKKKGMRGFFKRAVNRVRVKRDAKLLDARFFYNRVRRRIRDRNRLRRHLRGCKHRCCGHQHRCPAHRELIVLGVREQIMSTVPSVSRTFENYPEQDRYEPPVKGELRPCRHVGLSHLEDHIARRKNKGVRGFFRRTWRAVKRPFHCHKNRVEPLVPDKSVPHTSGLQKTPESKPNGSQQTVSVPSATENNKFQYIPIKVAEERTLLFVPPMFQPSSEISSSVYDIGNVILWQERFGSWVFESCKSDGQKVAIKQVMRPYWSISTYTMAGYMDNIMTEVAMLCLMNQPPISPYVIRMLEWFHEPFDTTIVFEDPGPCTILRRIVELHPLGEKIARVIMRQAVQAAQDCIAHGVFHYNIGSRTILVNTSTLEIKLTDFGYSLPYTGRKYNRPAGQMELYRDAYSAVTANAFNLGWLLYDMVYRPYDLQPRNGPRNIFVSTACKSLIDWCICLDQSKRPRLEQILQHRWFTQD